MVRIPTMWRAVSRLLRTMTVAGVVLSLDSAGLSANEPIAADKLQPATPVPGALVIGGGGLLPDSVIDRFFELGEGPNAKIVIITTASQLAGTDDIKVRFERWMTRKFQSLTYLHTRDRDEANRPEFSHCLTEATAVWFAGGNQNLVTEAYRDTLVERRCHEVLKRNGVVGGTSAGAAIMSRTMIAGGVTTPTIAPGLAFLPGTIVDQHFAARNRQDRLMHALENHPGHVGFGVNECTALVVRGRTLEVVGDQDVTICLGPTESKPARIESLPVGKKEDLIRLSRAAIGRRVASKANTASRRPEVTKGTLVIAGVGPTPAEAVSKFFNAAGGKTSSIVLLSAMGKEDDEFEASFSDCLKAVGAANVRQVRASDPSELNGEKLKEVLSDATGVWIAGSQISRMVESYLDAPVHAMFADVLRRGGAIGGTSAGAAMQGEFLVDDGIPDNNTYIAEGYDRGFGFLPGVAIGQPQNHHENFDDMTVFKKSYPELVGLEVPEATALIVSGTTMEVVGKNPVSVYDRKPDDPESQPFVEVVKAGQSYDFKHRRRVDVIRTETAQAK
mgnify:CR=1 FL=1